MVGVLLVILGPVVLLHVAQLVTVAVASVPSRTCSPPLDACVADQTLLLAAQLRGRLDKFEEEIHKHNIKGSIASDSAMNQKRVNEGQTKASDQLGERLRRKSQQLMNAGRAVAT